MAPCVLYLANMKRSKLAPLKSETVRVLSGSALKNVQGGYILKTGDACPQAGAGTGGCQSTDPDLGGYVNSIYVYYR